MLGFLLLGAGIAGLALVESVTSNSFTFALPLPVTGLGMGCVIAPVMTEGDARGAASHGWHRVRNP